MSVIVHLVPASEWPGIEVADEYRPATLEASGYVHCVAPDRTVAVAEALFSGRDDLLAVCLDADRLDAPVRYETADTPGDDEDADGGDADGGDAIDDFPHVYGPLNADAVVAVVPFPPDDDGGFSLPDALRELERG